MEGHDARTESDGDGHGAGTRAEELERVESELAGVERALTRLDDGTFGTCEVCQARLDEEQLAADPVAVRCADHR